MDKVTDGIMNETNRLLDSSKEEERRRAMKLRKRAKKKVRKQRDKSSCLPEDKVSDARSPVTIDVPSTAAEQVHLTQQSTSTNNDQQQQQQQQHIKSISDRTLQNQKPTSDTDNPIDYVTAPIDLSSVDCYGQGIVHQFSEIFKHFDLLGSHHNNNNNNNNRNRKQKRKPKGQVVTEQDTNTNDNRDTPSYQADAPRPALSRKKLKAAQRYTLDELKELATVPEVVEMWDTSAMDPLLLVDLKSYRNTVPVPIHWRQRQKYLYQHRDEDKPPFVLPDFIKNTGVMEARDNLRKQQERKRQKTKTRERRNPKLGKTDLDYQDLHDAFFLYQTEPRLTRHGDLYFERKETVSNLKSKKPGELSDGLKEALGILGTPLAPPPWLLQMQRYGPPPSYPHLKIPGLTAPLPAGAQWGLQQGGWGLIPVDGFNRPLYAGVFKHDSLLKDPSHKAGENGIIDRTLWGELDDEHGSTHGDDNDNSDNDNDSNIPPTIDQPLSVLDTERIKPINMDVGLELETSKRKRRHHVSEDGDNGTGQRISKLPKLYDIIPAKNTATGTTGWMGPQHTYDLSSSAGSRPTWTRTQDVTVSLDPNALDDYGTAVQEMYQKAQEVHMPKGVGDQELQQMYTDHAKRQAKKKRQMDIRNADKKKDFRF